jgi:hypothetical protein
VRTEASSAFALSFATAVTLVSAQAGAGTLTTIYTFTGGADGGYPAAGLISGPDGSFFGTTSSSPTGPLVGNGGTVFQLFPPAQGLTAWTLQTLYTAATTSDGTNPTGGLVSDAAGNLYGAMSHGGIFNGVCAFDGIDFGCGTLFKLNHAAGSPTAYTYQLLYTFSGGADGEASGGLVTGPGGVLYGLTEPYPVIYPNVTCNTAPCGSAYALTPPTEGQTSWTKTTLYSFAGGVDGSFPTGTLLMGKGGVLYGTTISGGLTTSPRCRPAGCGTVFSLTPPSGNNTSWTKTTLWIFSDHDGAVPNGSLVADASGNLFGLTNSGGDRHADCVPALGCGAAYELSPGPTPSSPWTFTSIFLVRDGAHGAEPTAGVTLGSGGQLYLTTSGTETTSFGTVNALYPPAKGRTVWRDDKLFGFDNDANSALPLDTLLFVKGTLYGTAFGDYIGPAPYGTIFSITP